MRYDNDEDSTSVLNGFMINSGNVMYGGGISCWSSSPSLTNVTVSGNSAYYGGGIYCWYSSPSLTNVTITGNTADMGGGIWCEFSTLHLIENVAIKDNTANFGGGIHCNGSNTRLENMKITNNLAEHGGGGIYCMESNLSLKNVSILNNSALYGGGGIVFSYSSPSLTNVTITGNSTDGNGGGISCNNSNPSSKNVNITGNSAEYGGGVYCTYNSNPSLENVTITGNSALYGGGIYCFNNSNPSLVNCILWNDTPQEICFRSYHTPNSITIAYSDINGGEELIETNNNGTVNWLEGNIDADPLFVDALMGNYNLTEDSPCIDAGTSYFEYDGQILVDLSEDEYWGIAPDMGAYEYGLVNNDEIVIENGKWKMENYPNPFNPETNIRFELFEAGNVLLEIYNIKGQKVTTLVNKPYEAGSHTVTWNATGQSSGVYLMRIVIAEKSETKKLILLK